MVYFAVLTHNRPHSVIALLSSIFKLTIPPKEDFKVLILDNGSSIESREIIEKSSVVRDPRITYWYSPQNVFMEGKCHLEARVLAEACGTAGFIAHLDDDVQLAESWLLNTWNVVQVRGLDACGSVEESNGRMVFSGQKSLVISEEIIGGRVVKVWDWQSQMVPQSGEYSLVQFAGHRALLVRLEAARLVKHDARLLIGGEDVDYSQALLKAGFSIGIAHQARILHRALGEYDAANFRTRDKVLSSWRYFYQKWGFVRRNACTEVGLREEEWLKLVTQESDTNNVD